VGWDALSAFFLVPILGLSTLAAIYGGGYMIAYHTRKSIVASWVFFNAFVAGMVMVVIARTAILFLLSWEVMSLSAYFLVTLEQEKADVRRAGWVYLIATHLGVGFLFTTFVLLGRQAGSLDFDAFQNLRAVPAAWSGLIFVLALVGFGTKAGLVPFHVWLPEAHPAAPSHVSALMSGVMIKMGLYGLLRVLTFLGAPAPWWGLLLAGLGLLSGLVGIALALQQRDVKRVLAYSSIENIGLIGLALGVALWASAVKLPAIAVLALTAALLHVWSHGLMKSMLFFAAGSVLHATGAKDMEKLGGLMKRMRWSGGIMILGAVAICGLPPMNGFVSEWLMYLSLMKSGLALGDGRGLTAMLAVGLVALIGGLAVITFVRLTGIVLMGVPRSEAAAHAHESSPWMLGPMVVLGCLCLAMALVPATIVAALQAPLSEILRESATGSLQSLESSEIPLRTLGEINLWILIVVGAVAAALFGLLRKTSRAMGPTWGCGYAMPGPRMQYTGRSFAELMSEHLVPRLLRPRTSRRVPRGAFPARGDFDSECADPISEKLYEPFFRRCAERFSQLRILQQGKVNVYLIYMVVTVVLALAWVSIRR
jgi:formate hydrogenlyase subunit 3/multisubunit Na+/H+ antiporter MnhD subunit